MWQLKQPLVTQNNSRRTDKEKFLDKYFSDQLLQIVDKINDPQLNNRKKHLDAILDVLMSIADEYQAVMIEEEEGYWYSLEKWHDECQQREALEWVNDKINERNEID